MEPLRTASSMIHRDGTDLQLGLADKTCQASWNLPEIGQIGFAYPFEKKLGEKKNEYE